MIAHSKIPADWYLAGLKENLGYPKNSDCLFICTLQSRSLCWMITGFGNTPGDAFKQTMKNLYASSWAKERNSK